MALRNAGQKKPAPCRAGWQALEIFDPLGRPVAECTGASLPLLLFSVYGSRLELGMGGLQEPPNTDP